jgi:hypothetical protein
LVSACAGAAHRAAHRAARRRAGGRIRPRICQAPAICSGAPDARVRARRAAAPALACAACETRPPAAERPAARTVVTPLAGLPPFSVHGLPVALVRLPPRRRRLGTAPRCAPPARRRTAADAPAPRHALCLRARALFAGRATHYGGETNDKWSIDTGSCMRGKIASPFYVTALNVHGSGNTVRRARTLRCDALRAPLPRCGAEPRRAAAPLLRCRTSAGSASK